MTVEKWNLFEKLERSSDAEEYMLKFLIVICEKSSTGKVGWVVGLCTKWVFTGTLLWDFLSSPVQTVFSAHLFSLELPKCPVEHTALLKIGPW